MYKTRTQLSQLSPQLHVIFSDRVRMLIPIEKILPAWINFVSDIVESVLSSRDGAHLRLIRMHGIMLLMMLLLLRLLVRVWMNGRYIEVLVTETRRVKCLQQETRQMRELILGFERVFS